MIFYKVINDSFTFPRVSVQQLELGKTYNLSSYIDCGEFGNEKQVYFYEHAKPYKVSAVMTDSIGRKAFAVATNDSVRDNFPQFCLSKVLVSEGNHIVCAYSENVLLESIHIVIMTVVDIRPNSVFEDGKSINVKVTHKFCYDKDIVNLSEFMWDAVQHSVMAIRRNVGDFCTLKYSFNPGRIVLNRLFVRNEEDQIVSYLDDGRKLVLNRNSPEIYKQVGKNDGELIDTVILRCFYSKKHKDKNNIIVDGSRLRMVWENELPMYIEQSNLTYDLASTLIKKVILPYGNHCFAVVNIKGEIRPIFHSSKGFWTFPLNEYEEAFIQGIEDMDF